MEAFIWYFFIMSSFIDFYGMSNGHRMMLILRLLWLICQQLAVKKFIISWYVIWLWLPSLCWEIWFTVHFIFQNPPILLVHSKLNIVSHLDWTISCIDSHVMYLWGTQHLQSIETCTHSYLYTPVPCNGWSIFLESCSFFVLYHVYSGSLIQVGVDRMHKDSKYVLFLDDDVRLHPGTIGALVAEMEKNPEVYLCT